MGTVDLDKFVTDRRDGRRAATKEQLNGINGKAVLLNALNTNDTLWSHTRQLALVLLHRDPKARFENVRTVADGIDAYRSGGKNGGAYVVNQLEEACGDCSFFDQEGLPADDDEGKAILQYIRDNGLVSKLGVGELEKELALRYNSHPISFPALESTGIELRGADVLRRNLDNPAVTQYVALLLASNPEVLVRQGLYSSETEALNKFAKNPQAVLAALNRGDKKVWGALSLIQRDHTKHLDLFSDKHGGITSSPPLAVQLSRLAADPPFNGPEFADARRALGDVVNSKALLLRMPEGSMLNWVEIRSGGDGLPYIALKEGFDESRIDWDTPAYRAWQVGKTWDRARASTLLSHEKDPLVRSRVLNDALGVSVVVGPNNRLLVIDPDEHPDKVVLRPLTIEIDWTEGWSLDSPLEGPKNLTLSVLNGAEEAFSESPVLAAGTVLWNMVPASKAVQGLSWGKKAAQYVGRSIRNGGVLVAAETTVDAAGAYYAHEWGHVSEDPISHHLKRLEEEGYAVILDSAIDAGAEYVDQVAEHGAAYLLIDAASLGVAAVLGRRNPLHHVTEKLTFVKKRGALTGVRTQDGLVRAALKPSVRMLLQGGDEITTAVNSAYLASATRSDLAIGISDKKARSIADDAAVKIVRSADDRIFDFIKKGGDSPSVGQLMVAGTLSSIRANYMRSIPKKIGENHTDKIGKKVDRMNTQLESVVTAYLADGVIDQVEEQGLKQIGRIKAGFGLPAQSAQVAARRDLRNAAAVDPSILDARPGGANTTTAQSRLTAIHANSGVGQGGGTGIGVQATGGQGGATSNIPRPNTQQAGAGIPRTPQGTGEPPAIAAQLFGPRSATPTSGAAALRNGPFVNFDSPDFKMPSTNAKYEARGDLKFTALADSDREDLVHNLSPSDLRAYDSLADEALQLRFLRRLYGKSTYDTGQVWGLSVAPGQNSLGDSNRSFMRGKLEEYARGGDPLAAKDLSLFDSLTDTVEQDALLQQIFRLELRVLPGTL